MPFIHDAHIFAKDIMLNINEDLANSFSLLILCISKNKNLAPTSRSKKIKQGSEEHIERLAISFNNSRAVRPPTVPSTVPDDMVSVILESYFKIPQSKIDEAKHLHLLSMSAENIIGDLLERYIASVIEPRGWVWCSGSTVKSVDFILPPSTNYNDWHFLQIKNRDNSENSSSSAIRSGTQIIKWHRTFSRTGLTNWENFPDRDVAHLLSEEGFILFVREYLSNLI